MNVAISVFVICAEVIIYLFYNLHDCAFKWLIRANHFIPDQQAYDKSLFWILRIIVNLEQKFTEISIKPSVKPK